MSVAVGVDNVALSNMFIANHINDIQSDVIKAHKKRRQKSIDMAKTSSLQISAFVIGVLVNQLSVMEAWSSGWGTFVFGLIGLAVWQLILRQLIIALVGYLSDYDWMLGLEKLNVVLVVTLVVVVVSAGGGIIINQALQTNQTFFESIADLTVFFIIVAVIAFTASAATSIEYAPSTGKDLFVVGGDWVRNHVRVAHAAVTGNFAAHEKQLYRSGAFRTTSRLV
jgi:F0F1-type ATP synthase assembly protein I